MKSGILLLGMIMMVGLSYGQTNDSLQNVYQNSAQRLLDRDGRLTVGGYGHVDYNQPLNSNTWNNGKLDVHRFVMLFGYRFNERTQFITEIEYEHVKEVYIEQAFLQYKINNSINFRGGLILIPMGIINEYHEPTTFNGVERPLVDKYIAPSTWREIGIGLTGNIIDASIKYQAYIVNGFNGYDGAPHLNGKNGFRKGRQKGAESFISVPNFAGKIEYYGIRGLNTGVSLYYGDTQTTMYDGIDKNDKEAKIQADSSVVGIAMIGFDARYRIGGLQARGQLYYASLSNTNKYNEFTANNGTPNDLGSAMIGYYIEAGYNLFQISNNIKSELIPFIRYEVYDTHHLVSDNVVRNESYNNTVITAGFGWKITRGAVVKADMQFIRSVADDEYAKIFNAGIGVMF